MDGMMGEKEWNLHSEWLRKEEAERYKQSVSDSTTGPKVSSGVDGKQKPAPLGVSHVPLVVREGKFLVRP